MAARKAPAKKAPAKKAPAKKAVAAKKAPAKAAPVKRIPTIKEKMSKTAIMQTISDNTGLSKKDVAAVFGELETLIEGSIKKRALGEFTIPGLMKIVTVKKPAVKARKGINPFTGEETMFKAKPASTAVKVRPLAKLKKMAD